MRFDATAGLAQTAAVDRALVTAVERALGTGVAGAVPLHGGDVAVAYRVDLADGRRVFAKTHRAPPPGFFTTEAAGLAWLGEAGAVAVPEVLAVSDEAPALLVLAWIERGTARGVTEQDLGRRLAALHRAGAPCFGRRTGARREPGAAQRARRDVGRVLRHAAGCCRSPGWPRDAGALARRRRSPARSGSPAGSTRSAGRRRAAGPAARRPVGRQPARRRRRAQLADRPGRPRRPPRVRPGDDAPVRRLRRRLLRRLRRGATRSPPAGRIGSPLHQIAPLVVHAIKFGGGYVGAASAAIARYA